MLAVCLEMRFLGWQCWGTTEYGRMTGLQARWHSRNSMSALGSLRTIVGCFDNRATRFAYVIGKERWMVDPRYRSGQCW